MNVKALPSMLMQNYRPCVFHPSGTCKIVQTAAESTWLLKQNIACFNQAGMVYILTSRALYEILSLIDDGCDKEVG